MRVTAEENRLLWLMRDMVEQDCDCRKDDTSVYNSGYIRVHQLAMRMLVRYGHMTLLSEDEGGGRWYEARMVAVNETPNAFGRDVDGCDGDPVKALERAAPAMMSQVENFFDETPLQKKLREAKE